MQAEDDYDILAGAAAFSDASRSRKRKAEEELSNQKKQCVRANPNFSPKPTGNTGTSGISVPRENGTKFPSPIGSVKGKVANVVVVATEEEEEMLRKEVWIMFGGPPPRMYLASLRPRLRFFVCGNKGEPQFFRRSSGLYSFFQRQWQQHWRSKHLRYFVTLTFGTLTLTYSEPKALPELPIISAVEECKLATDFLKLHTLLAIDCEWSYSSDPSASIRSTDLCLVQIATPEKRCFLFDIFVGGKVLFTEGGLKSLLEDEKITKVFHDCRWDSDVLLHADVVINEVFDTQIGYAAYTHTSCGYYPFPVSLNKVLQKFVGQTNKMKNEAREDMENDSEYWKRRPFTPTMIEYAKSDVELLPQVHKEILYNIKNPVVRNSIAEFSRIYTEQVKSKTDEELEAKRDEQKKMKEYYEAEVKRNVKSKVLIDRWYPTYGIPEWDQSLKASIQRRQRRAGAVSGFGGVGDLCAMLKETAKKEREEIERKAISDNDSNVKKA